MKAPGKEVPSYYDQRGRIEQAVLVSMADHLATIRKINDIVEKTRLVSCLSQIVTAVNEDKESWNRRANLAYRKRLLGKRKPIIPWDSAASFPEPLKTGDATSVLLLTINPPYPMTDEAKIFNHIQSHGRHKEEWHAWIYRWVYAGKNVENHDPHLVHVNPDGKYFYLEGFEVLVKPSGVDIFTHTEASVLSITNTSNETVPKIHIAHSDAMRKPEALRDAVIGTYQSISEL